MHYLDHRPQVHPRVMQPAVFRAVFRVDHTASAGSIEPVGVVPLRDRLLGAVRIVLPPYRAEQGVMAADPPSVAAGVKYLRYTRVALRVPEYTQSPPHYYPCGAIILVTPDSTSAQAAITKLTSRYPKTIGMTQYA